MSEHADYASHLGQSITRYLGLKQALGREYRTERYILEHLDRFLASRGTDLTGDLFALWCAAIGHLSPGVRRSWMRVVRNLCVYRQRTEPACFVPDPALFPQPHAPRRPHLFTSDEIARLLHATDDLVPSPSSPLRPEVYRLAVVLLYTTGLRRGELVRLTIADYDPIGRILTIRASKFHKSRMMPLSDSAGREVDAYLVARRRFPAGPETPLLYHRQGMSPYSGAGLAHGLRLIFRRAGIKNGAGTPPRVHDLRHSFAHQAMLRWYRAGVDVGAMLPALAAYLGHVSVASTQYYLSFFDPFAGIAAELFAKHCNTFLGTLTEKGGDQ